MSENLTFPQTSDSEAPPKRRRSPESIEKQKATNAMRREIKANRAPVDLKTGLEEGRFEELEYIRKLADLKAEIDEQAIPEDNRLMVHQEIKVDMFTIHRQYVELTPSMCRVKNCSFDAAQKVGCAGWAAAPLDQPVKDGGTYGEELIRMREYHEQTGHTVHEEVDHIITASELHRRQWAAGNTVKGEYLKGMR